MNNDVTFYKRLRDLLNLYGGYGYENLNTLNSQNILVTMYQNEGVFGRLWNDLIRFNNALFDRSLDNRPFLKQFLLYNSGLPFDFENCWLLSEFYDGCGYNDHNFIRFYFDLLKKFTPFCQNYSYETIYNILISNIGLIYRPDGQIYVEKKYYIKDADYSNSYNKVVGLNNYDFSLLNDRYIYSEYFTFFNERKNGETYWVSSFIDGLGYDVLNSGLYQNKEKLIEVKSSYSESSAKTYFSTNELKVAQEAYRKNADYYVYLLDFTLDTRLVADDFCCMKYEDNYDFVDKIGNHVLSLRRYKYNGLDRFYNESGDYYLKLSDNKIVNYDSFGNYSEKYIMERYYEGKQIILTK